MSTLPHDKVYARLGISKIHGVGVFAIKPIPAGTMIFDGDEAELIWVRRDQLTDLSPAEKSLYDFGLVRGDLVGCPRSFNNLTPGYFVNHNAHDPNLLYNSSEYYFYAARDIAIGEELTANYHTYADNII